MTAKSAKPKPTKFDNQAKLASICAKAAQPPRDPEAANGNTPQPEVPPLTTPVTVVTARRLAAGIGSGFRLVAKPAHQEERKLSAPF